MSDRSFGGPPPGWYAESAASARLRWWTGSEWTDHYRDPSSDRMPAPEVVSRPRTRAEARAAVTEAVETPVPRGPIVWAPEAEPDLDAAEADAVPEPETKPEPRPVAEPEPRREPIPTAPAQVSPAQPSPEVPVAEPRPPVVVPRPVRHPEDAPLRPIVYRPQTSAYVGEQPAQFLAPTSTNGFASAALALVVISLVGEAAVFFWLRDAAPGAAEVVRTVAVAAAVIGFILAVAGMAVAVQRPTRKARPVVALVVTALLLLGLALRFALALMTGSVA